MQHTDPRTGPDEEDFTKDWLDEFLSEGLYSFNSSDGTQAAMNDLIHPLAVDFLVTVPANGSLAEVRRFS